MAKLVTLGSVRSVPLIAILAHMEDFPVDRDPIFNATTSLELDPRAITFATLITMHMLQSISDLPTTLPTRIVPSRDVSAVLSDRPSFLKSKLASLGEGEPLQFTGYYTYGVTASDNPRIHDPPTRFVLRYDPATGTLRGNGQDVEDFTIDGNVDANGLVTLNKAYQSWSWKWIGVFLRWGMAGLWGSESRGGMFYVWQQDQNSTNTTAK
ncbi:hypothetical protein FRB98_004705 [Tulasnella sp. 332]|nr:hypothetical protein FRB98_004705 [Tulasnella sp. 332]